MRASRTYKFIGKVFPDGHLSIPDEIAQVPGKEFEVFMAPIDEIRSTISRYPEGDLEKTGWLKDVNLDSAKIEDAIEAAFGTTEIDTIFRMFFPNPKRSASWRRSDYLGIRDKR